jgi:hypothetical protein
MRTFKRLDYLPIDRERVPTARDVRAGTTATTMLVITRDQPSVAGLRELMRGLAATARVIHVALRNPHDLALSAGLGVVRIAAYSDTPPTLGALAEKLINGGQWLGRLPVPETWTRLEEPAGVLPAFVAARANATKLRL